MSNPYIYPILFVGTLEVIAFIAVKILLPGEDVTVTMGAITLALGQVVTFLINSAQAETATVRADLATERANIATARAANAASTAVAAKEQVQSVSDQVSVVNDKANESQITSRTGLSALVKSEDLVEFDRLADAFSKTTLTYEETLRFVELLKERVQDDLTIQQLTAAKRILEIATKELATVAIHRKVPVPQTEEERVLSQKIQRVAEEEQREAGTRKSGVGEGDGKVDKEKTTPVPHTAESILTMPNVVKAAEAAAESAEETKTLTEEVVVQAAKAIELKREEKKG